MQQGAGKIQLKLLNEYGSGVPVVLGDYLPFWKGIECSKLFVGGTEIIVEEMVTNFK